MAFGTLEVNLLGARGLARTDFLGKIDPYVVIQYGNQQRTSSIARDGSNNPEWNEKFKFSVEYQSPTQENATKHQYMLSLTLMDKDTFTQDDPLGQTMIYLKDVIETAMENGMAELGAQKYRVVAEDKTYRGEILVGITFTKEEDSKEQIFGGWKASQF